MLSLANTQAYATRSAIQSAAFEAATAIQQDVAMAAHEAAKAASLAVSQSTHEITKVAAIAQEAAGSFVIGISGSDLAALSELANDARGTWVEVDAQGIAVGKGAISCLSPLRNAGPKDRHRRWRRSWTSWFHHVREEARCGTVRVRVCPRRQFPSPLLPLIPWQWIASVCLPGHCYNEPWIVLWRVAPGNDARFRWLPDQTPQ